MLHGSICGRELENSLRQPRWESYRGHLKVFNTIKWSIWRSPVTRVWTCAVFVTLLAWKRGHRAVTLQWLRACVCVQLTFGDQKGLPWATRYGRERERQEREGVGRGVVLHLGWSAFHCGKTQYLHFVIRTTFTLSFSTTGITHI